MSERVMVVTGAFATHTTKLYNYYVCPANWNLENLEYIAVNYFGELKYIGKIIKQPISWSYSQNGVLNFSIKKDVSKEIQNDLFQFRTLLNYGNHKLFILKPIYCPCTDFLKYKGKGAFVYSHRFFDTIDDMLNRHQNKNTNGDTESDSLFTAKNEGEINY